jgi:hypothetical protein
MRLNAGHVRDALAFIVSVAAAFLYELDARQLGIAAWVATMLGSAASIYLQILIDDPPNSPPRTALKRIFESLIGGTIMSLLVLGPNLFIATLGQRLHPDYDELHQLPSWQSFAIVVWRSIRDHGLLVGTIAIEIVLRVRQTARERNDRAYSLIACLAEFGRFIVLLFALLILHVLSVPTVAVLATLVILYVPTRVFEPKE